jgi:outer membrane murein-binding lipoprotein Lpp
MTARREPSGELQEVKSNLTTNSFRWALLVLVASMHPMGRTVLKTAGFDLPAPDAVTAKTILEVQRDVNDVKGEVAQVKTDVAQVKSDIKDAKIQFARFEVDFDRWKKGENK